MYFFNALTAVAKREEEQGRGGNCKEGGCEVGCDFRGMPVSAAAQFPAPVWG